MKTIAIPARFLFAAFALIASWQAHATNDPVQAQISSGQSLTCATASNGVVKCWGVNLFGSAGTGGPNGVLGSPGTVIGSESGGYVAVSASSLFACALSSAGAVTCWGGNQNGEQANGTSGFTTNPPAPVAGLQGGVAQISAGGFFACALMSTGTVKCWGKGSTGAMGNGTTPATQTSPVDVTSLPDGAIAIATGNDHACAITPTRGLKCWGLSSSGQLGRGEFSGPSVQPTAIDVAGLSDVATIAAGHNATCAITMAGALYCWGAAQNGILGNGDTLGRAAPTPVVGMGSGVTAVAIGGTHACAVVSGAAKCWGGNLFSHLGDGTTNQSNVPVDVVGLNEGVVDIAVSQNASCALTRVGRVLCWGHANGTGNGTNPFPALVPDLGTNPKIAPGMEHACAVMGTGALYCWGANESGQLGTGDTGERHGPAQVIAGGIAGVTSGRVHSCALTVDQTVKCWGNNQFGQLGNATNTSSTSPVDVTGLGGIVAIGGGMDHTCAIDADGAMYCWGWNLFGQLGDGTNTSRNAPVAITGFSGPASAVRGGNASTCASTTSGALRCWGSNQQGQLGIGTLASSNTPVDVPALSTGVANFSLGLGHACAVTTAGAALCWGDNSFLQLGDGTSTNRTEPTPVATLSSGVKSIAAGGNTCALMVNGTVKCWGNNSEGSVGDGTGINRDSPVDVPGLAGVDLLVVGGSGPCAVPRGAGVKCWGYNGHHQVGDTTTASRFSPKQVWGFGQVFDFTLPAQATAGTSSDISQELASNYAVEFTSLTPATCTALHSFLATVAAGVCVVRATQAGDDVWFAARAVTRSMLVTPAVAAAQSITFGELASRQYAPASFTVTASASSTLAVQFSSLTPATCSSGGTNGVTITMLALGICEIAADQAGNVLYLPAPRVSQSFVISIADQAITYTGITDRLLSDGVAQYIPSPTDDSGGSGAPLVFASTTPTVCIEHDEIQPNGRYVFLLGAGVCTATVNKAGSALYNPAPQVQVSFTILKSQQSISFGELANRVLGSGSFTLSATGGASANPVTFTSLTPACSTNGTNGASVTLLAAGECTIAANQAGNANFDPAPQVTRTFTVTRPPGVSFPDFDGDGKPDLIWSNTATGVTFVWHMNGAAIGSDAFITQIDPTWQVQGVADFNGDGHPDLVWRNSATGATYVWYMVDGVLQSDAYLFSLPPSWVIQGVADFNGDGKPDFLMRNLDSGVAFAWYFDNATAIGDGFLFGIDPVWKVEAVADFDNDGQPDLMFRNASSGLAFAWSTQYSGGVLSLAGASEPIFSIDPAWEVVQAADWNADGSPDLVFRNTATGLVFVWYMNGTTLAGSDFITQIDPAWEIVP